MSPRQPAAARNVRVPDVLWANAQAIADQRDETVSEVIRRALEAYVRRHAALIAEAERVSGEARPSRRQ